MKRIVFKSPDRIGHIQLNDSENASAILHNVQQNEEEPLLPTGYGPENKQKNEQPKPESEEPLLPTGFGNKPKK